MLEIYNVQQPEVVSFNRHWNCWTKEQAYICYCAPFDGTEKDNEVIEKQSEKKYKETFMDGEDEMKQARSVHEESYCIKKTNKYLHV